MIGIIAMGANYSPVDESSLQGFSVLLVRATYSPTKLPETPGKALCARAPSRHGAFVRPGDRYVYRPPLPRAAREMTTHKLLGLTSTFKVVVPLYRHPNRQML